MSPAFDQPLGPDPGQFLWATGIENTFVPQARTGQRALDADFCSKYVGENIAEGQTSVDAVMLAWKNSPHHNENMLHEDYVYVGMGHYVDPTGRQYWAQEFALDVP